MTLSETQVSWLKSQKLVMTVCEHWGIEVKPEGANAMRDPYFMITQRPGSERFEVQHVYLKNTCGYVGPVAHTEATYPTLRKALKHLLTTPR